MNDRETLSYVSAMTQARKQLLQEARMIEIDNLPLCPCCGSFCHCDMIENKDQRVNFVVTGLCPLCQDDVFWGK